MLSPLGNHPTPPLIPFLISTPPPKHAPLAVDILCRHVLLRGGGRWVRAVHLLMEQKDIKVTWGPGKLVAGRSTAQAGVPQKLMGKVNMRCSQEPRTLKTFPSGRACVCPASSYFFSWIYLRANLPEKMEKHILEINQQQFQVFVSVVLLRGLFLLVIVLQWPTAACSLRSNDEVCSRELTFHLGGLW